VTYADLVLFQIVDGLQFAFPNCMQKLAGGGSIDRVLALKQKLAKGSLKAYLASDRRLPYSDGIFRYYKELDD
jgi:glutathione S-transferase